MRRLQTATFALVGLVCALLILYARFPHFSVVTGFLEITTEGRYEMPVQGGAYLSPIVVTNFGATSALNVYLHFRPSTPIRTIEYLTNKGGRALRLYTGGSRTSLPSSYGGSLISLELGDIEPGQAVVIYVVAGPNQESTDSDLDGLRPIRTTRGLSSGNLITYNLWGAFLSNIYYFIAILAIWEGFAFYVARLLRNSAIWSWTPSSKESLLKALMAPASTRPPPTGIKQVLLEQEREAHHRRIIIGFSITILFFAANVLGLTING